MEKETKNDDVYKMLSESGYSDKAIQYFQEKKNLGVLDNPNQVMDVTGPCGDTMKMTLDIQGEKISLRVHPEIADLLLGEAKDIIISLEKHLHRQVVIYPVAGYHIEEFNIVEIYTE